MSCNAWIHEVLCCLLVIPSKPLLCSPSPLPSPILSFLPSPIPHNLPQLVIFKKGLISFHFVCVSFLVPNYFTALVKAVSKVAPRTDLMRVTDFDFSYKIINLCPWKQGKAKPEIPFFIAFCVALWKITTVKIAENNYMLQQIQSPRCQKGTVPHPMDFCLLLRTYTQTWFSHYTFPCNSNPI